MGKNIVVVGGSAGIGLTLVKSMAAKDHRLFTFSRNKPAGYSSTQVEHEETDVSLDQVVWPGELPEEVHGLAYFPGSILLKPFPRLSRKEILDDIQINVLGAVSAIQHVLPHMKKSGGSIVLISTVAVKVGLPFHSSIAMAKGALEGLALSLAAELAPKIRVNVVAPSIVQTTLSEKFLNTTEKEEASARRHALQRIGTTEDVANMVEFLLCDQSAWISGQVFRVDGGLSAIRTL